MVVLTILGIIGILIAVGLIATGVAIFAAFGDVIFVAIIVYIIVRLCRRKKKKGF